MHDPALSDALREAYASAPVGEVIWHTLELRHPAFAAPIRVVRDVEPVSYEYRPEHVARYPDLVPAQAGERVPGVLAQDLERTMPSAVADTSAGKVVDSRQVASTALAASAAQQDELDELDARLGGIEKGLRGGRVDASYYR